MANIRLPQSSPAIGMPGVPRLPDPPASPDTSQYVGAALSGLGKMLDAHAKDSEKRATAADALLLTSMGYEAEVGSIFSEKINPIVQDDNGVVDMLATIKQSEHVISNYVPLLEEAASEALEYLDGIDLMGKHTKDKLKAEISSVLAAGIGDEKAAHRKYRNIADEALVGLTIQGLERETQKALDGDNIGDLTKSVEGANSLSSTLNDPALRKELKTSLAKVDSNLKSGITASVSNKINAINNAEKYERFPNVRRLIKNKEAEWIRNAKALVNSKPRGSGDGYWPPDLSEKESKAFSENPELASYLKRVEASRLPGKRAKALVGILFSPNGPNASQRDLYRANVKAIDEESEEDYLEKGNMMRAIKGWGVMGVIPNKETTPKFLNAIKMALNDNDPDEEDMDFILWASENRTGLTGLGEPLDNKLEDFADKLTRRVIHGDRREMLSAWNTSEKISGTEKSGNTGEQVRADELRLTKMKETGFLKSNPFWWDGEGRNILEDAFDELFPTSSREFTPVGPSGLPEFSSTAGDDYGFTATNREEFEKLALDRFMSMLIDYPDRNQVAILNDSIQHIKSRVFQKSHGGRMEVMRYGERAEIDVPILDNYLKNRLSNNAVTAEGWAGSREEYIDSIYETGRLVTGDLNGRTNAYYYELEDGTYLSDRTTPGKEMLISMWGAKRSVLDPKWLSDESEVKESIGGAVGPFPVHELSPLLEEEYKELPVPEQIKVFESAIARGGNLEDGPWDNRAVEDILGLESWSSLDPEFKSSVIGHILSNEKEKREQQPFITNPVTRKYFEDAVKEISRAKRPRRATRIGAGAGSTGYLGGGSMSRPLNPVWTDALTQEAVIRGMELFEKYELADVSPQNLAKLRDRIHLAGFKFDPEEAINGAGTTSYIVNEVLKGGWSPYVPGKNLVSSVIKTVGVTMRERRDRPWINEAMDGQESSYFAWEGGRKRNPKYYSVAGILSRRVKGVPVDNGPWPELALLKGSNGKLTKANVVSWLSDNDLPTEVGASSPLNAFDLIRAEASGLFMEPDARLIFAMSDTQFVRLLSGLIEEEEK